jgi:hypothetical protein
VTVPNGVPGLILVRIGATRDSENDRANTMLADPQRRADHARPLVGTYRASDGGDDAVVDAPLRVHRTREPARAIRQLERLGTKSPSNLLTNAADRRSFF